MPRRIFNAPKGKGRKGPKVKNMTAPAEKKKAAPEKPVEVQSEASKINTEVSSRGQLPKGWPTNVKKCIQATDPCKQCCKVGKYMYISEKPCKADQVNKSKTGKHGSAKYATTGSTITYSKERASETKQVKATTTFNDSKKPFIFEPKKLQYDILAWNEQESTFTLAPQEEDVEYVTFTMDYPKDSQYFQKIGEQVANNVEHVLHIMWWYGPNSEELQYFFEKASVSTSQDD